MKEILTTRNNTTIKLKVNNTRNTNHKKQYKNKTNREQCKTTS
jgi:hypothetical protein